MASASSSFQTGDKCVVVLKFDKIEYHNEEYLGQKIFNSRKLGTIEIPFKYLSGTIIDDCFKDTCFDPSTEQFVFELPKKFENILPEVLISWLQSRSKKIFKPYGANHVHFWNTVALIDFLGLDPPRVFDHPPFENSISYSGGGGGCGSSKSYSKYDRDYDDYYEDQGWMSDDEYERQPVLNMSEDDNDDHYLDRIDEEERMEREEMEAAYEEFRNMCITEDSSTED